jgi:hypothetical protein
MIKVMFGVVWSQHTNGLCTFEDEMSLGRVMNKRQRKKKDKKFFSSAYRVLPTYPMLQKINTSGATITIKMLQDFFDRSIVINNNVAIKNYENEIWFNEQMNKLQEKHNFGVSDA